MSQLRLVAVASQNHVFDMTGRSTEGSKYKKCHSSGITYGLLCLHTPIYRTSVRARLGYTSIVTYGTRLQVVSIDRYLFGESREKVLKIYLV